MKHDVLSDMNFIRNSGLFVVNVAILTKFAVVMFIDINANLDIIGLS